MIQRGEIADILEKHADQVLASLSVVLPELADSEIFDLLELLEDQERFHTRLPLRIQIYALIYNESNRPELKMLALLRLLRRLGSRRDAPDLGPIPSDSVDFAKFVYEKAKEFPGQESLSKALSSLAMATLAYRTGDLAAMKETTFGGLNALADLEQWSKPSSDLTPMSLLIAETGHELYYIGANAAYRAGDIENAREMADDWSELIEKWEFVLGPLSRQRYQYYQLAGQLNFEVGLLEPALDAFTKALDFAPTPYRKAFIWLRQAKIEREMERGDESWEHAVAAIEAFLESPFPQAAASWIEWIGLDAESEPRRAKIDALREEFDRIKGIDGLEINRVTRAMTELYRILGELRTTSDPGNLNTRLDDLITELEKIGSWKNLITLLSAKAVVAGRLNDRESMDSAISRARDIINTKLTDDARPPLKFFLESAHALALRDVGAYEEALNTLFEKALEARKMYPGGFGPDERTAMEAVYYLGALSGLDPETIDRKIRDTISISG